jgi:hypothetical protein
VWFSIVAQEDDAFAVAVSGVVGAAANLMSQIVLIIEAAMPGYLLAILRSTRNGAATTCLGRHILLI